MKIRWFLERAGVRTGCIRKRAPLGEAGVAGGSSAGFLPYGRTRYFEPAGSATPAASNLAIGTIVATGGDAGGSVALTRTGGVGDPGCIEPGDRDDRRYRRRRGRGVKGA